jgi:hypothetical protein
MRNHEERAVLMRVLRRAKRGIWTVMGIAFLIGFIIGFACAWLGWIQWL